VNGARYLQLLNEFWDRVWLKCHSQYDVRFTLNKTERHIISPASCEAGWIKFFLSEGLGAEDQSNSHQDPRTWRYLDFPLGSSTVIRVKYPGHVPLTTSKKYPFCYHMRHSSGFRTCVIRCAASCQPVRASGRTLSWTFVVVVPVPMKLGWWDARYNNLIMNC